MSDQDQSVTDAGLPAAQIDESPIGASLKCRRPWWLILLRPKVGIPLAILLVAVSIPLAYRSWRISSLPPIDEPFDVEAFRAETISDEENAFIEYHKAFDLFIEDTATREEWKTSNDLVAGNWNNSRAAFETWIAVNDPTLAVWLDGTKKPKAISTARHKVSFENAEYVSKARMIARLATIKAGRHLHQNNPIDAWELSYSAYRFSRHVGQNGIATERSTGVSIHRIASSGILAWSHHPKTRGVDIDHAIVTLSKDYLTMTAEHSMVLKHEYLASLKALSSVEYGDWIFAQNPMLDTAIMFLLGEPEFSEVVLRHVLANQLLGVDTAPAARPPLLAGDDFLFDWPSSKSHPVSGVELAKKMAPVPAIAMLNYFPLVKHHIKMRKIERLFQTSMVAVLAIETFVRRQGRFPNSLQECLSSKAAHAIIDPFQSANRPLIFRANADYAVVYSLGADGMDDAYPLEPPDWQPRNSITPLHSPDSGYEGYRIPLWKPRSDDESQPE
jgi:hypothetical protein